MNESRQADRLAQSQLARHFVTSAFVRGGAIILGLLINSQLALHLSNELYALYGIILSTSILLAVLVQFGYQSSIVRIAASKRARQSLHDLSSDIWGAALVTMAIGTALTVLLSHTHRWLIPSLELQGPSIFLATLVGVFVIARGLNMLFAEALRGLGNVGLAASLTGSGQHGGLFRCAIFLLLILAAISAGSVSLSNLLWISIISSAVAALVSGALIGKYARLSTSTNAIFASVKTHLPLNARLASAEFLQLAGGTAAANIIGGWFVPLPYMAPIIAAQQVSLLVTAPLNLMNGSLPAILIEASESGATARVEKLLRNSASFILATSIALVFIFVIPGTFFFRVLFGESLEAAWLHFLIMVPGILANCASGSCVRALYLLGHEKTYLRGSLYVFFVSVPIYVLGSIYFGAPGVSAALSAVLVIQNITFLILARHRLGFWTGAYLDPRKYLLLFFDTFSAMAARRG